MRASRGGGVQGVRTPWEITEYRGFSNTGPDPQEITKPAFYDGPSSARQRIAI